MYWVTPTERQRRPGVSDGYRLTPGCKGDPVTTDVLGTAGRGSRRCASSSTGKQWVNTKPRQRCRRPTLEQQHNCVHRRQRSTITQPKCSQETRKQNIKLNIIISEVEGLTLVFRTAGALAAPLISTRKYAQFRWSPHSSFFLAGTVAR